MRSYTYADLIPNLGFRRRQFPRLPVNVLGVPPYNPPPDAASREKVFFAVETFARHMTDEAWQLQVGQQGQGYTLLGRHFGKDEVDVSDAFRRHKPSTAILQDKREWDSSRAGCYDKTVGFHRIEAGAEHSDVFRVTIHKDLHHDPSYHHDFHNAWKTHAWIVYYNQRIATHLCPWMRPEHVVRTYHSVDASRVPAFSAERPNRCLLSGQLQQKTYPLRTNAANWAKEGLLSPCDVLHHPGYHANGAATPDYLQTLSGYKVSICTASIYGYALRKIIESTACGCVVITDLPADETLPEIDGNLIRVHPGITHRQLTDLIRVAVAEYDPELQEAYADAALKYYDYRNQAALLAANIETLRNNYPPPSPTNRSQRKTVRTTVTQSRTFTQRLGQRTQGKGARR